MQQNIDGLIKFMTCKKEKYIRFEFEVTYIMNIMIYTMVKYVCRQ